MARERDTRHDDNGYRRYINNLCPIFKSKNLSFRGQTQSSWPQFWLHRPTRCRDHVESNQLGNPPHPACDSQGIHQMPPSLASESSSGGHTFVPLNEDSHTTDTMAHEHASPPRDIQRLIAPTFHHYSGSPLSRAGCVLFFSTLFTIRHSS